MKKLLVSVTAVLISFNSISQQTTYTYTKADGIYLDSLKKYGIDWNIVYSEFIVLLNQYRKQNNLDTLVYSNSAYEAAKFMTEYCLSKKIVTHDTDIDGYQSFSQRCDKFNLNYGDSKCIAGECGLYTPISIMLIEQQYKSKKSIAEFILNSWKKSKGHNMVLLTPYAKYIGICSKNASNIHPIYAFLVLF